MDDLIKPDVPAPIMPVLPQLLGNAMPPEIPQMRWDSGAISDLFHNWKLRRVSKASELEAEIAEAKSRTAIAYINMTKEFIAASSDIQRRLRENEHEVKMMEIDEQKGQAELIQVQLKNQLLHGEVKLTEVELKIKMKEMEEILGTATP